VREEALAIIAHIPSTAGKLNLLREYGQARGLIDEIFEQPLSLARQSPLR